MWRAAGAALGYVKAGGKCLNYQRMTNSCVIITATPCRAALGLNWETEQFTANPSQLKDSNTRGQKTAQNQGGCNLSGGRVKVF